MSELPKGWETTPLADVCRIVRGVTYNKSQASDAPEPGYIPVLRANNIQPPALVHEDLVYVPESCVSPDQMIAAGDIVIAMSSGSRSVVGKAAQSVNQWAGSFGAFCGVLRPFSDMHAGFIGHFCRSKAYRDKTTELAAGVNINNLKPSHFSEIEIPVPPFAEQARIAHALDGLLAQVDTLKGRLDALPALIKRFRQSVLSAAVTRQLTTIGLEEPRTSDTGNETEVTQFREVRLGDVATDFSYGTSAKSQKAGSVPVLRMGNIQNGKLDWHELVYTSDCSEIEKYKLSSGDILFNRTNSPELVGKTAIYKDARPAIYAGYLIRVRCGEKLLPDYLNHCLNSPQGRDYCWQVKTDGVSQSNINAKKLADFRFDLPSIEVQAEIVRRVEQLFAFADQLEARLADARARVDSLTQSILAKAFRGELVPQDPADEPASVLLERIKAQRAAAPKPKRGRKSV